MAKLSELQSQDTIELQEIGNQSRSSERKEDGDSFALMQAGKTPVLRVSPSLVRLFLREVTVISQRNFSLLSMFGFSCLVLGTWQGALMLVDRPSRHHSNVCCANVLRTFGIGLEK